MQEIGKVNKDKSGLFEKLDKVNKSLARPRKKNRSVLETMEGMSTQTLQTLK